MYLVFAGDKYYPSPGWNDFKGKAKSMVEALRIAESCRKNTDWYQIVELDTLTEFSFGYWDLQ